MRNQLIQQILAKQANSWTHDESGIVFYMMPLYVNKMNIIHDALLSVGVNMTRIDTDTGRVADAFAVLEAFCVGCDIPDDLPKEYEPFRFYWEERNPLTYQERWELFINLSFVEVVNMLGEAYRHTRDGSILAPQEILDLPDEATPELDPAT